MGSTSLYAQQPPKREFRGVWVATVKNIDWPSQAGLDAETQQQELIELLDFHRKNGMNAIIMQIRPSADAFYESKYEPWSEWLTGQQGRPPMPYYDPLDFAIDACHKRGMEFHAWINPYRAVVDYDSLKLLAPGHIVEEHPEWFVRYGANLYFDPGIPDARDYVMKVVLDVVRRYDIDAVHFDDYFYPYRIPEQAFPDTASFRKYGGFYEEVEEWRRHNVSEFIRLLSRRIKLEKPWVKFGISPFSVWRNQDKDPLGSPTRAGQTSYDDLYADIRKWLENQWIDYVAPQLYFSIGYELVPYEKTLDWWRNVANGRHLYAGHGVYKINNNADKNWELPDQIPRQIRLNREFEEVQGSIFFSARSFKSNPLGINDSLRNGLYARPALVPVMGWLESQAPLAPAELEGSSQHKGVLLSWQQPQSKPAPAYYAIYRFKGKKPGSTDEATHLLDVVGAHQPFYLDTTLAVPGKYTYVVTALDRIQHESGPQNPFACVKVKRKHLFGSLRQRLLGRK